MTHLPAEVIFAVEPGANHYREACVFCVSAEERDGFNAPSTFEFIPMMDHSHRPNTEFRKTIRRHAMTSHIRLKRQANGGALDRSPNRPPQIDGPDPFAVLPVKIEPYMQTLLHYYTTIGWKMFYSIEKHTIFNPMTEYWLSLAYRDAAFMHTIIGCAESHFAESPSYHDRPITVKHLNAAISIINRRLANSEVITDGTLVVIATMAMIEKHRGAHANWKIHMEGLKKLLRLRGGLGSLESQPLLMTKLHRADLCGSVDALQVPYFSRRSILNLPMGNAHELPSPGFRILDQLLHLDTSLKAGVHALFQSTVSFQQLGVTSSNTEAAKIRYWITETQYMLLSLKYAEPCYELCRVALILFTGIFLKESPPNSPVLDMLITKIQALYEESAPSLASRWGGVLTEEFSLWIFFLTASVAASLQLREWSMLRIMESASLLRLNEWEATLNVLRNFLWDSSFNDRFRCIWDDASPSLGFPEKERFGDLSV
ncbi:uncharacterized protein N7459_007768 [Penicillium hispanicum]|uniref:uncharacterized protein n=1 Tax=Penicillium hispanicum TaxID=1080232 RepID=UPI00253FE7E0|nr:uncharacterized protein N7459_007768 [Penicillium hispanicum]KAJ5578804.1 hypothetical protein N7459_007768 [Penicillium hispanicum]